MDLGDIQFSSEKVSTALIKSGTAQVVLPSTTSVVCVTTTVAHNYDSDELVPQVFSDLEGTLTPWTTPDGRYAVTVSVDSTNIYFRATANTAGSPTVPYTITFSYKLMAI